MANGTPGSGLGFTPSSSTLDAASRLIFQLGVPTVFALVLLWFVIIRVQEHLTAIVKMEETRLANQLTWQRETIEIFTAQNAEMHTQTQLFRDILATRLREEREHP